jgi:uncharacterized protein
MNHFFENQKRLLDFVSLDFKRFLYEKIDFKQRLIGIVGPRGTGKTTLLLQHLKELNLPLAQGLYVSMDDIFFAENKLVDFIAKFVDEYDGKLIILDEVHKYPSWNQELKNIYDSYPELQIIFSGSSSLDLIKGHYDLSRRGIIHNLPGLSFREYLEFNGVGKFESYSLENILDGHIDIAANISGRIKPLKEFKSYLKTGYMPYFKGLAEGDYFKRILLTVEKTIQMDLGRFYSIKSQNSAYFYKILYFLATIPPGQISVNNLAGHLSIANETVAEYLEYLKNSSLIRYLNIDARGGKLIRNAAKVFLDNPNLLLSICNSLDQSADTGTLRELFVVGQLQNAEYVPTFIKKGDISVKNFKFEIGGKGKDWTQLGKTAGNYLILDETVVGEKQVIPLYLFGFLY